MPKAPPVKEERIEVVGSAQRDRLSSTDSRQMVTRQDLLKFGDTIVVEQFGTYHHYPSGTTQKPALRYVNLPHRRNHSRLCPLRCCGEFNSHNFPALHLQHQHRLRCITSMRIRLGAVVKDPKRCQMR
jgi:hypothetical protein